MEPGPCGAPVAWILLIVGIGLQIGRAAGEDTKSWGPLRLNGSSMLEETQNPLKTITPDEPFPFPPSLEPVSSRIIITQSPDLLQNGNYANSNTDVLVDQVLQDSTSNFQLTTSMASSPVSYNSMAADEAPPLSSTILYSSVARETGDLPITLDSSLNDPALVSPEHIVATSAGIAQETSSYGEHLSASPSLEECSSIFWTDTLSQSDIIEDTLGASSARPPTSLDAPVSKPTQTSSEGSNSLTNRNALQTLFSASPSLEECSSIFCSSIFWTDTLSQSSIIEDTLGASSARPPTSLDAPVSQPTQTSSEDSNSLTSRNALQTLFSRIWLSTAQTSLPSNPIKSGFTASFIDFSRSPLETSGDESFTVSSTPTFTFAHETLDLILDVASSKLDSESRELLETILIKPSALTGKGFLTSMVRETEVLEGSNHETFVSVFPSWPVVSLSSWQVASLDFSSLLDTSIMETPLSTLLPSLSMELEPRDFSELGNTVAKSTFMDSTFYSTDFLELESPSASTSNTHGTLASLDQSVFETVNAIKDTASTNAESVMHLSETLFPLEEPETVSSVFSSHWTVVSLLEPSSTLPLFSEEISTSLFSLEFNERSSIFSQGLSAVISTPEFSLSSSLLESSLLSTVDTIDFTPWQTSTPYLVASLTPFPSSDWGQNSSNVFSESSELWEATSSLQLESEFLFTSSSTGANSTLLPSSPFSDADTVVPSIYTSTVDYYASSDLATEAPQTLLLTTSLLSSWLPESIFVENTVVTPESTLQTQEMSVAPTISLWSTLSELSSLSESLSTLSELSLGFCSHRACPT
ncbi:hypothetical protein XENTR_v10007706 [Xenopus tropicalis]|uniref:Cell wall protein RBR3-like n=1 Tax=Xenopus tropicalis TaxID=8364 RepID=A0A8J1JBE1_XENTR|nr:cell wall protein RBR3-like [Xenopus tropicalis]KAE8613404.1 hypothetical protein XENTR_v10007706 [Xenopus tropicalis]